jgi:hypothetical protein
LGKMSRKYLLLRKPMSLENDIFTPVHGDKGSIIAPIILLSLVIAITISSMIVYFQTPQKLQARARHRNELENIRSVLVMYYSSEAACQAQILKGNFGGNISSMSSVSLDSPDPSYGSTLAAGQTVNQIKIDSMGFNKIVDLSTGLNFAGGLPPKNKGYRATLEIKASDSMLMSFPLVTIPFYLVTDSSGKLLSCRITSFIDPEKSPNLTTEDFLCRSMDINKKCFGKTPCTTTTSTQIFFPQIESGNCITP